MGSDPGLTQVNIGAEDKLAVAYQHPNLTSNFNLKSFLDSPAGGIQSNDFRKTFQILRQLRCFGLGIVIVFGTISKWR